MSQHHKITPYVPYSLPINSFHNHKDLIRKRPSKVIQLKLAETIRVYSFPKSYPTKLIKLLKSIKGLKRLSLDHSHLFKKNEITLPSILLFIKKAKRIQELALYDSWIPVRHFETELAVWMKYFDCLKKMTFKLEILKTDVFQKNSFSSQMKSFLNTLRRRQIRMKSLNIQLPKEVSFVNPILVQTSKYPKSLKNLQLLCNDKQYEGSCDKFPDFHLNYFKKLDTFALQTTDSHFALSHIFDTLPSLPQLKSLAVFLPFSFVIPEASPLYGPYCYHIDSQAFSNLTHLSLRIPHECMKVTLLERLNLENLRSLYLSFMRIDAQRYQEILSNLSKMKRLKILKLSITYESQLENLTKILFESLVDLEEITSLNISLIHFTIIPGYRPKGNMPSEALLFLDRIFQKPIKIREFSFECKNLIISDKFSELMSIFSASGESFKKLKVDTFPFKLNEDQTESLIELIEHINNVRALKLPCFDIDSNQIWTRLVSETIKLKEIRSIVLGRIGGEKVEEQAFVESLEKILEKRGLQSLKCDLTEEFNKKIRVVNSPLSFENISMKNPFLKFISDNLLL